MCYLPEEIAHGNAELISVPPVKRSALGDGVDLSLQAPRSPPLIKYTSERIVRRWDELLFERKSSPQG